MRVLILILAGILTLTSCGGDLPVEEHGEDIYKIGVFEPLSGEDAEKAQAEINGIELAHELNPTALGKKVELVYANNKSNTFDGKLAAQKLINSEVDIILGSYGNVMSMLGGEFFADAKIPAIAITNTNPLVTRGNAYYLRVATIDSFQASMAANFILNEFSPEKLAIIRITRDDYGLALAQSFSQELEKSVEIETIEVDQELKGIEKKLLDLKEEEIEIIYMPCGSVEALDIIEKCDQLEYWPQFIGTHLWRDEDFLSQGGRLIENIIFTDYFDSSSTVSDKTSKFVADYRRHYEDEEPPSGAALGYDAYMLAIDALKLREESQNTKTLLNVLINIADFEGVTGRISFNEDGDPIKPILISTVKNGEFRQKDIAEPKEIINNEEIEEDE